MRILTGIQSTGIPHLGNLLGAILPAISMGRSEGNDGFLFIADLHSFTTVRDPVQLRENTYAVAAAWLACGLDVDKVTFYRQSDVAEVTELAWHLGCLTPYPMLANAHSFKDKSENVSQVNAGLFYYPVLMAADILLYDTNLVPVGKDQKQHLEITRDIASAFNRAYGEDTFVMPEAKIDGQIARSLDRDDMVRVAMETFNSVTIGCARCHNHKFDPVTQHDYYALQAVFAAVDRADQAYDPDPQVHQQRRELLRRQFELENERRAFDAEIQRLAGDGLKSLDQKISQLESSTQGNERPEFGWHSGIEPRDSAVKWVQVDLGRTVKLDRVAIVGCHDTFNNIGAGFGFPVRFRVELSDDATFGGESRVLLDRTNADVPNPGVEPQVISADGAAGRYVRVTATRLSPRQNDFIFALGELQAFDEQGNNVALNAAVTSLDSIEAPVRWARKNLTDGYYYGMGRSDEAKQQLATMRRERESLVANALVPERRARRAKVEAELTDIDARLKQLPAPSLVYSAATQFKPQGNFKPTGGEPREIRLLRRGNVVMPDEVVEPGSLAAMPTLADHFQLSGDGNEGARRAALANWLTDVRNPLTWRTIVNRVWLYHFGRGLVDTPNDFGRMGQMPTHPELLDWMAVEFRDGEQSLKQLHRLICNSATYRQSSADRDECSSVDADNRWLWRMNRRRLDAESIRDAVLLVSGSLDTTMYGPGFQDFLIEKPEHSPHYQYHLHDPTDPRTHRRSIYRFIVRSQQQPFMTTLDCADPSMQVEKRNETVTPLQSLAMLNNKFMVAMAERFAGRLAAEATELDEQVRLGLRQTMSRPASDAEVREFTEFARQHGLPNACRVMLNLNEFVFVD
ncbi:MAG: tryptophan--tRNA ligase [Planctomycetales bacterium]|nr:tryptophan--tRNA ligase [Planctomycetales bacterium]